MSLNANFSAFLQLVDKVNSILLIPHVSPDGDALGSVLALKSLLVRKNKQVAIMVDSPIPSQLKFLPEINDIMTPHCDTSNLTPFDLAVAVDVAAPERMGAVALYFNLAKETAVIDHHENNTPFGKLRIIDGNAPATAILISQLYEISNTEITKEDAICLYTALTTDTGNLLFDSTTPECFTLMAKLLKAGLPLSKYGNILFLEKEESFVRALGVALSSLRMSSDKKIAGVTLTMAQLANCNANDGDTNGIVNYALDIAGVKMAYFLREVSPGVIKGSLRCKPGFRIDEVAAEFTGGGHKMASGYTVHLEMPEAIKSIENALAMALAKQEMSC